jgi:tetratricopeptide (TPR) repeat protein
MKPASPRALFNSGNAAVDRGELIAAVDCYREAVFLNPSFPQAHFNLALLSKCMGRNEEAIAGFRRALELQPNNSQAHCHLADIMHTIGNLEDAADHYREALRLDAGLAAAHNNLGNTLRDSGDLPAAISCFRNLVRLCPHLAEGHYNLGSALMAMGKTAAATAALLEAVRLKPDYAGAWNNLGLACKAQTKYSEAIKCFSQALRINPGLAEARWNRAFVRLLTGDFAGGWQDFEARYDLSQWRLFYPFRLSIPRWAGEPQPSGTLLVHDEQGLGDTLQFVRYLPWVKQRCARVIVETQSPLVELLKDLPGIDEVTARPAQAPVNCIADAHIALMSLPLIFSTDLNNIPSVVPYIWPDIDKRRRWAALLQGPGLKVGIVWAGRPEHHNDKNRSCMLAHFASLAHLPGVRLFSLQKGPAVSQISENGLQDLIENLDPELRDFTDTAAILANLDLLISIDTSVAHLAGAMARPVWLLLPFIPDWRWLLQREDSPWYPTMRLFRQQQSGDWGSVFRRLEHELQKRTLQTPTTGCGLGLSATRL